MCDYGSDQSYSCKKVETKLVANFIFNIRFQIRIFEYIGRGEIMFSFFYTLIVKEKKD